MTNFDLTLLRELAEKADKVSHGQTVAHCDSMEWADFIAAADPPTVIELLDKIDTLQRDLAKCRDKCGQLEREADWLATYLADVCRYVPDTDYCPINEAIGCPCDKCRCASKASVWREAARMAVEAQCQKP